MSRKIELIKAVNVIQPFKNLLNKNFMNWSIVLALSNASKELDNHNQFYVEQVKKLLDTYAIKLPNGNYDIDTNGNFKFKSVSDAEQWQKEIVSLQNTLIDIFDVIEIPANSFKQSEDTLTVTDVRLLEDFVKITLDSTDKKGDNNA